MALPPKKLLILYGTETGNAEDLAEQTFQKAKDAGVDVRMENVFNFPAENLKDEERVAIIISTWGEGDPPDEATDFCDALNDDEVTDLDNLEFCVLALGDSGYDDFCGCGRKVDESLERNGAKRILDRIDCDVDFEEPFEEWQKKFFDQLGIEA
ncbi:MAG: flavodoxin domain-containing protein [Opitutales bacterium]